MIKTKSLVDGIGNYKVTNRYYDDWSPLYDQTLLKWNYGAPKKCSIILSKYISSKPKNMFDLACGTGLFAKEVLKFYPKILIDGADISRKILDQARKKKIYKNLTCLNFDKKILIRKKYDLISCIGALTYTKNPKKLFTSINNLTLKGGYFILLIVLIYGKIKITQIYYWIYLVFGNLFLFQGQFYIYLKTLILKIILK